MTSHKNKASEPGGMLKEKRVWASKNMHEGGDKNFDVSDFDYNHEISVIVLCLRLGHDFYLSPRTMNNGPCFHGLKTFLVFMGHAFMLPQPKMSKQVPTNF